MPELERNPEMEGITEASKELSATPSAIEFDGFSYWDDEKKTFIAPDAKSRQIFFQYLDDYFAVWEILEYGPYLVLRCETLPEPYI